MEGDQQARAPTKQRDRHDNQLVAQREFLKWCAVLRFSL